MNYFHLLLGLLTGTAAMVLGLLAGLGAIWALLVYALAGAAGHALSRLGAHVLALRGHDDRLP